MHFQLFSNIIQALLRNYSEKMLFQKICFQNEGIFGRKRSAEKTVLFNTQVCRSILINCIDFKETAWSGRLTYVQAGISCRIQSSCLSALTTDAFLLFLHDLHCTLLGKKAVIHHTTFEENRF